MGKKEEGTGMKLGIAGAGMIVVQGLLEFVHDIEGIELLGICATKRLSLIHILSFCLAAM